MITIQHDNDTWSILSEGATRDGKIFCHLASTTRFRRQRNGANPVQICEWIDHVVILAAAQQAEEAQRRDYVDQYYRDRAGSGLSPLEAHR
jgi:hypothetical protein